MKLNPISIKQIKKNQKRKNLFLIIKLEDLQKQLQNICIKTGIIEQMYFEDINIKFIDQFLIFMS